MGKHQLRLLKFAIAYPGWHSLSKNDPAARNAVQSLTSTGLLELGRHEKAQWQFRLTPPTYTPEPPNRVFYANRSLMPGSIGG